MVSNSLTPRIALVGDSMVIIQQHTHWRKPKKAALRALKLDDMPPRPRLRGLTTDVNTSKYPI